MKSDNSHTINPYRRTQFLYEAILILIGVAFCGYLIFSPGSRPNSRASTTQTSQPTLVNTAISSTLTTPEQVTLFDLIWTSVNDYYLYTDFNGLDWKAIRSEYVQKIEAGLSEDDFYREMEGLIGKLGNKHTRFLPPRLNNFETAGIGIGVLSIPGENRVAVTIVIPNSSAAQVGILPNDRILAVDGKQAPVKILELVSLINGMSGTKVGLTVQTPGQEPRQVELTRGFTQEPIPVPYKEYTTSTGKNTGYIFLVSLID